MRILLLSFIFSFISVFSLFNNNSTVLPGTTEGHFGVTDSGSATYYVPIQVTPGTSGMEPNLGLSYNNSGGNSSLGMGWSLSGLSMISRTTRTIAKDQYITGVDFSSNDVFSLDGERLIQVDSTQTYGAPNTEYRAENNSFTKVISYGNINGNPTHFTAWTRDGLILEYGNSADSRIEAEGRTEPVFYTVNKISDRNGTYMTFEYEEDNMNGEFRLKKVDYSAHDGAGLTPYNKLEFVYEGRPDSTEVWLNGSKISTTKRLKEIINTHQSTTVKTYSLGYEQSEMTEVSRLISIQEFGSDGTCFEPLSFTYEAETIDMVDVVPPSQANHFNNAGYNPSESQVLIPTSSVTGRNLIPIDLNTDGHNDFISWGTSGDFHYLINDLEGSGDFNVVNNSIGNIFTSDRLNFPVDLNGDQVKDLFGIRFNPANNTIQDITFWYFDNLPNQDYLANTIVFNSTSGFDFSHFAIQTDCNNNTHLPTLRFTDINGDGLVDLWVYNDLTGNLAFYFNNGKDATSCNCAPFDYVDPTSFFTGGPMSVSGLIQLLFDNQDNENDGQLIFQDVTGDNLLDAVFFYNNQTAIECGDNDATSALGDGTLLVYENKSINSNLSFQLKCQNCDDLTVSTISGFEHLTFANLNRDGLPEFVFYNEDLAVQNNIKIFENRGNCVYTDHPFQNLTLFNTILYSDIDRMDFVDWNGDGLDDVIYPKSCMNCGAVYRLNEGEFTFELNSDLFRFGMGYDEVNQQFFGGFTNEGSLDILTVNNQAGGDGITRLKKHFVSKGNQVVNIKNGLDYNIDIEYSNLTVDSLYDKTQTLSYPEFTYIGPMTIVSSYATDNGIGGKARIEYEYKNAYFDLEGRGFRGFEEVRILDKTTGTLTGKKFEKDEDYSHIPKVTTQIWDKNGCQLSEKITYPYKYYGQNTTPPLASPRGNPQFEYFFTMPESSVERTFDAVFFCDPNPITTVISRYQYDQETGDLIYSIIDYGDGHIDSMHHTYNNNLSNWILGRISRTELHRFSPNSPPSIRVTAFEYDPNSGQLKKETSEPDLPTTQQIVTTYVHDVYGNINQSKITFYNGTQYESRFTTTIYNGIGRYITKRVNSIGHEENIVNHPLFGGETQVTGANGLVQTIQYDGFGRPIQVNYPDGNAEIKTINKCNGDCPTNAVFYTMDDDNLSTPDWTYYDKLGRELMTKTIAFNGDTVAVSSEFLTNGQVGRISDPYEINDTSNIDWIVLSYDFLGRESSRLHPGNLLDSTIYSGLTTISINAKGQSKTIKKDVLGRMIESTDNEGNKITYEYDSQGNLIKTTDPEGNVITFTYDIYNNRIGMDDPDAGVHTYTYNSIGELLSTTYPNGQIMSLQYDNLGRLVSRTELEGTTTWEYDNKPNGLGFLSKVSSAVFAPDHQLEYFYTSLGRLDYQEETILGNLYTTDYDYDFYGRPTSVQNPNGHEVEYQYNPDGYMHQIIDKSTTDLIWRMDELDIEGRLKKHTLGNDFQTEYTYDADRDFLLSIKTTDNFNTVKQDLNYIYDDIGNVLSRNDLTRSVNETFGFDGLNRLTYSHVFGQDTTHVAYDILGNITSKSNVGTYFYGENGAGPRTLTRVNSNTNINCIPSAQTDFEYTSFNKTKVLENDTSRIEITYGVDRHRIQQKTYLYGTLIETKTYLSNGEYEIVETPNTTRELTYISAPSVGVVSVYTNVQSAGDHYKFWLRDNIGSLYGVVDENGIVDTELSFDAWGARRNLDGTPLSTWSFDWDRGFTGHEHIDIFQLVNMNGRIYDPILGRFTTPDPFIQEMSNLQNFNRYAYVLNNPLSYVDPSGFFFKKLRKKVKRGVKRFVKKVKKVAKRVVKTVKKVGRQVGETLKEAGQLAIDFHRNPFKTVNDLGKKVFGEELWTTIVVTAITIAVAAATSGAGVTLLGAIASGALGGFAGSFTGVMVNGGDLGDSIKAGLKGAAIGAASAGLTWGVGQLAKAAAGSTQTIGRQLARYGVKMVGHGVVQGSISEHTGGKFSHGLLSGVVSSLGAAINTNNRYGDILIGAAAGGTASAVGGGKFANGAVSGAMNIMYNKNGLERQLDKLGASPETKFAVGVGTTLAAGGAVAGILMGAASAPFVVGAGIVLGGAVLMNQGIGVIQNSSVEMGTGIRRESFLQSK